MRPFLFVLLLRFSFSSTQVCTKVAQHIGDCATGKLCKNIIALNDNKYSGVTCPVNFHIEARESGGPYIAVRLKGDKGDLECKDGVLSGKTETGLTVGDITRIMCVKEICRAILKPFSSSECDRERKCKEAIRTDMHFECTDDDYDLEVKKEGGTSWEKVTSQSCIGEKGTATVNGNQEGIPMGSAKFRCSKAAVCEVDINGVVDGHLVCSAADNCQRIQITPNKKELKCDNGFNIEIGTDDTKEWNIAENLECFNKIFYEKAIEQTDKKLRCRKKRTCTMAEYHIAGTMCEDALTCKAPGSADPYACGPSFDLQYFAVAKPTEAWTPAESIDCHEGQFRVKLRGQTARSAVVPLGFRCVMDKGCDVNAHSDTTTLCAPDDECEKPTRDINNNNELKCGDDYGLQALKNGGWIGVQSISCVHNRAFVYTEKGGNEGILDKTRCVRKNNQFDHMDGCESEQECVKPTEYAPMKCPGKFQLQAKEAVGGWDPVKSIYANSHEFVVTKEDDSVMTAVAGIRCMRKKCSACADPCPSLSCQFQAGDWDTCASVGCGAGSRTTIGTESFTQDVQCHPDTTATQSFWKKTDGSPTESTTVTCEKLCTLSQPQVTSSCESDDVCEKIELDDDKELTCRERMARKSNPTEKGTKLVCDKTVGEWKLTNSEGVVSVDPTDNIYCAFEACDITSLCPNCKPDEKSPKDYRCPPGKEVARIRQSASGDLKDHNSVSFSCVHGTWMNNEGSTMQSTDSVECLSPAEAASRKMSTGGSKAGLIVALVILFLLLLVVLILYVFCKLKGNGWLHVIIMDKIRGKKKKTGKGKKEKTSRKGSPMGSQKGDSFSSGKPMTTEKEAGTPDQNQSAEGVSQTGVSCEKFSTEQTGGSPSPTPIEPVEASPTQVIA